MLEHLEYARESAAFLVSRTPCVVRKIHEVRFPSERCLPPFGSALHLAGKQGLLELLRGKGYIVKLAPRGVEAKPKARQRSVAPPG
jgi:hypothetical protein